MPGIASRVPNCPICGYSWIGLPEEGHCPECGQIYDHQSRRWFSKFANLFAIVMLMIMGMTVIAINWSGLTTLNITYEIGLAVGVIIILTGIYQAVFDYRHHRMAGLVVLPDRLVITQQVGTKNQNIPLSTILRIDRSTNWYQDDLVIETSQRRAPLRIVWLKGTEADEVIQSVITRKPVLQDNYENPKL